MSAALVQAEFPSRLSRICYSLGHCTFSSHSAGIKRCIYIILQTEGEKTQQRGEALKAELKHNRNLRWPKMVQPPMSYEVQQQREPPAVTFYSLNVCWETYFTLWMAGKRSVRHLDFINIKSNVYCYIVKKLA